MTTDAALQAIQHARVVPVVRATDVTEALRLIERVVRSGLAVIELTTTIPDWSELVRQVHREWPQTCVGVGTVMSRDAAAEAVAAGAEFCVTPYPVAEVRPVVAAADVALLEGGLAPSEVLQAAQRGVAKLFPADLGGVRYLRSLLSVAPAARIMPTGGIALEEVAEWLAAGAFAVGVGSDLARGDLPERLKRALTP
jgi:2-dehydro-3-deoxyphosphogluconate aldolase/(4S)-4-hydroxy-2-oxoglutarate aldolase